MQTGAPKWTPGSRAATAPDGAWLWSPAAGRFVAVEPRFFELHPIEDAARAVALQRGECLALGASQLLLWAPDYAPTLRHRGRIAVALEVATAWYDGAPELWVAGKPYVFLRAGAVEHVAWLQTYATERPVGFTYDGASLYHLIDLSEAAEGVLVVELVRAPE